MTPYDELWYSAIANAEEVCRTICRIYDTNEQERLHTYAKRRKNLRRKTTKKERI